MQKPLGFYLLLAGVILLAFWMRVESLRSLPEGLSTDEAVTVLDAFDISRGWNFPMYEDFGHPEDATKSEPLYQVLLGVTTVFFGVSVWTYRFTAVLTGTLTIATAYWATTECLRDLRPDYRRLAGLAAGCALAVAISHITLSRTVYRAILQPPLTLLFAGFLLRGLRTGRRRDLVLSGVSLAGAMYTYTAALILPAAFAPLAFSLLIFQRRSWRKWISGLAVTVGVVVILMLPFALLLVERPDAVLGRSRDMAGKSLPLSELLNKAYLQFFVVGDHNLQYNSNHAPLLPPVFNILFMAGLLALVARIRKPSTALVATLLVLSPIPSLISQEQIHGLRIMGAFAIFPVVIGFGVVLTAVLLGRLRPALNRKAGTIIVTAVLLGITAFNAVLSQQTYHDYWKTLPLFFIYDRKMGTAEWFMRTDRRDFSAWLNEQQTPLLVPVEELRIPTTHAWLLKRYTTVHGAGDDFSLPAGTQVVVPWALEFDTLRTETRQYALLQNDTITLLPPLTEAAHNRLIAGIDGGQEITREGTLNIMARVMPVPDNLQLAFEPRKNSPDNTPIFEGETQLLGWRGPDTYATSDEEETARYTLDWTALRRLGHEYSAFLQIQTQNYEYVAGDDTHVLRWLYPSSQWGMTDMVYDPHQLKLPANLQPGAYRLVAGMYVFVTPRLEASLPDGTPLGNAPTIGWVKVAQSNPPDVPADALTVDATFADTFHLMKVTAEAAGADQMRISLYWESLTTRPPIDATIFMHIIDTSGQLVTQDDTRPWGGQYPTFIWDAHEVVKTEHLVTVGQTPLSELTLLVGMYTQPDFTRLVVSGGQTPASDNRVQVGTLDQLVVKQP